MMHEQLRRSVLEANRALGASGLVILTWGNVSGTDSQRKVMAIKPSGIPYSELELEQIVLVDIVTGETLESRFRPSSDFPTHLELYRSFPAIGGIVHTHSPFASAWAQCRLEIPAYGTTHADTFHGPVPVTRLLTDEEIAAGYEQAVGAAISRLFHDSGLDPAAVPGVLVPHHGPFVWGVSPPAAVEHAVILEETARMAWYTRTLAPDAAPLPDSLLEKHFQRKHGPKAYYGQGPNRQEDSGLDERRSSDSMAINQES